MTTAAAAAASSIASAGSPAAITPRLLNLKQTAAYLGCSYWSARDWILAGLIPVVALPPLRPREGERPRKTLRRVLVDRVDLDAFIERQKHPPGAAELQSGARHNGADRTGLSARGVPAVCPDSRRG